MKGAPTVGRLIILILVIVTVVVLWRAFGPGSADRIGRSRGQGAVDQKSRPQVAGPEDDPDFLWEMRKERHKQQREKERQAAENLRNAEQRARNAELRAAEAEQRAREAERHTDIPTSDSPAGGSENSSQPTSMDRVERADHPEHPDSQSNSS